MHIFGQLVHIFGELAHIFGNLVHIFARKLVSRTSKQVSKNSGPLWQPGVYNDIKTWPSLSPRLPSDRKVSLGPHLVGKVQASRCEEAEEEEEKLRQKKADKRKKKQLGNMKKKTPFGGFFLANFYYTIGGKMNFFGPKTAHQLRSPAKATRKNNRILIGQKSRCLRVLFAKKVLLSRKFQGTKSPQHSEITASHAIIWCLSRIRLLHFGVLPLTPILISINDLHDWRTMGPYSGT